MSSSALAAWPRPREIMVTCGVVPLNSCANLRRILLRSIPARQHGEVPKPVSSLSSGGGRLQSRRMTQVGNDSLEFRVCLCHLLACDAGFPTSGSGNCPWAETRLASCHACPRTFLCPPVADEAANSVTTSCLKIMTLVIVMETLSIGFGSKSELGKVCCQTLAIS